MNAPGGPGGADPNDAAPSEWIEKAEGDIAVARRLAEDTDRPSFDAVAFHCQQAIEKLMKAVLRDRGVRPPKVHDLAELHRRLHAAGVEWSWPLTELRTVTMSAVHARYPGYHISSADAADVLKITERVWASLRPLV